MLFILPCIGLGTLQSLSTGRQDPARSSPNDCASHSLGRGSSESQPNVKNRNPNMVGYFVPLLSSRRT